MLLPWPHEEADLEVLADKLCVPRLVGWVPYTQRWDVNGAVRLVSKRRHEVF
jgi:hypothetical protein